MHVRSAQAAAQHAARTGRARCLAISGPTSPRDRAAVCGRANASSLLFFNLKEITMAKAYWVSAYRAVKDADKLAAYAKLAGPAITTGGGRFLARGLPVEVYEFGLSQRTVLIEFDSVEHAKAVHDSPDYQAALAALGDGAERDLRIIEGV